MHSHATVVAVAVLPVPAHRSLLLRTRALRARGHPIQAIRIQVRRTRRLRAQAAARRIRAHPAAARIRPVASPHRVRAAIRRIHVHRGAVLIRMAISLHRAPVRAARPVLPPSLDLLRALHPGAVLPVLIRARPCRVLAEPSSSAAIPLQARGSERLGSLPLLHRGPAAVCNVPAIIPADVPYLMRLVPALTWLRTEEAPAAQAVPVPRQGSVVQAIIAEAHPVR